jgi:corrinoid protein of di/trimethylamine methyltransferase
MTALERLKEVVKNGDDETAVRIANEMLQKIEPQAIVNVLTEGMREMGEQFEKKTIYLPELLIASEALMAVMDVVEPHLKAKNESFQNKATVVIGTVAGDIHEIGKNIVSMLLKASGYHVIDLGLDVAVSQFISKAEEINADVIGLSALMTSTRRVQKEVIEQLSKEGKREKYKVIIGGAAVSQKWANEIGADAYCEDAFATIRYMEALN